jgi:hypothetical protein
MLRIDYFFSHVLGPCDGDGRLGIEISPTTSPSTPLCASGERYFSYRDAWQGVYFFFICAMC